MKMNKEEFYAAVAVIFAVENTYETPKPYRRRWGQRLPGNGRYKGVGVIRWYSPTLIHCMLSTETRTFSTPETALQYLMKRNERH